MLEILTATVSVAQSVERWIVAPVVVGSIPITHPNLPARILSPNLWSGCQHGAYVHCIQTRSDLTQRTWSKASVFCRSQLIIHLLEGSENFSKFHLGLKLYGDLPIVGGKPDDKGSTPLK